MSREIALAYGIAGLSLAVAVVAVAGSTIGLLAEPEQTAATTPAFTESWSTTTAPGDQLAVAEVPIALQAVAEQPVEVVYVDEPAGRRHGDDDDDDERWEHDDDRWEHDDDDRTERVRWERDDEHSRREGRESRHHRERDDD